MKMFVTFASCFLATVLSTAFHLFILLIPRCILAIYCSYRKKLSSEKGQVAHPRSQLGPDLRFVSLAPLFVAFGVSKS